MGCMQLFNAIAPSWGGMRRTATLPSCSPPISCPSSQFCPLCLILQDSWRDLPVEKRIEHALIKGIDEFVVGDTEEARTCGRYPAPLNVRGAGGQGRAQLS